MKGILEKADYLRFEPTGIQGHLDAAITFRAVEAAFEQALKRHPDGVRRSFYTFAGQSVRVRIVGRQLAEHIVRPFAHLQISEPSSVAPQLTIDLWDENETSVRCQARSARSDPRWSEITAMSADGRFVAQRLPNTLAGLDREAGRIVGSIAWSDRIFIYERATRPRRV